MTWPPNFSDLNHIKHLRDVLGEEIRSTGVWFIGSVLFCHPNGGQHSVRQGVITSVCMMDSCWLTGVSSCAGLVSSACFCESASLAGRSGAAGPETRRIKGDTHGLEVHCLHLYRAISFSFAGAS